MKTKSPFLILVLTALAVAFTYSLGYQHGYRSGHIQSGHIRPVSNLRNVGLAFKTHDRNVVSPSDFIIEWAITTNQSRTK